MRHREPERSGAWKKIVAYGLFAAAIVYAVARFAALRPEPPSPPPLASQWARMDAEKINKDYAAGLTAAGLTAKQQEWLSDWERRRGKAKDAAARQAIRAELDDVMTKEQQAAYQRLVKERSEKRAALNQAKQDRVKRLIGEQDYARHQEDLKKIRDNREAARRANNPTPAPSPTP